MVFKRKMIDLSFMGFPPPPDFQPAKPDARKGPVGSQEGDAEIVAAVPSERADGPEVSLEEMRVEAGSDWEMVKDDPRWLQFLARTITTRRSRELAEVPLTYTAKRFCSNCGPVWLEPWNPATVEGCPWCLQKDLSLP